MVLIESCGACSLRTPEGLGIAWGLERSSSSAAAGLEFSNN